MDKGDVYHHALEHTLIQHTNAPYSRGQYDEKSMACVLKNWLL